MYIHYTTMVFMYHINLVLKLFLEIFPNFQNLEAGLIFIFYRYTVCLSNILKYIITYTKLFICQEKNNINVYIIINIVLD